MPAAFRAGSFDCRVIADGSGGLPAEMLVPNVPARERDAAFRGRLDRDGRLPLSYGCLLVRGADAIGLIDTGIGGYEHPHGGRGGELDSRLEAEGLRRDDIQFVVVTHAHLDHTGGLCSDREPRFARARHLISRVEWDWVADDDDPIDREQLLPLHEAGILELAEVPMELVAGIRLVPAPGHTPGHLAVEIGPPGGALYLADAAIDELHVEHPGWTTAFDENPDLAAETRQALLDRACEEERIVAGAHLRSAERIERDGEGFRLLPTTAVS